MRVFLHLTMNILFLVVVAIFIYDFNTTYSDNVVEIRDEISEASNKIKSGEMILSPQQYSKILNEANDWTLYFVHLNVLSIISILFYLLAVCAFYVGVFVGKRDK
jgi:short subunit fatty acids transporter